MQLPLLRSDDSAGLAVLGKPVFTVLGLSPQVMYQVNGFLEKNRDTLPADIVVVLRTTENKLLQQLFSSPLTKTGMLQLRSRWGENVKHLSHLERRYSTAYHNENFS